MAAVVHALPSWPNISTPRDYFGKFYCMCGETFYHRPLERKEKRKGGKKEKTLRLPSTPLEMSFKK